MLTSLTWAPLTAKQPKLDFKSPSAPQSWRQERRNRPIATAKYQPTFQPQSSNQSYLPWQLITFTMDNFKILWLVNVLFWSVSSGFSVSWLGVMLWDKSENRGTKTCRPTTSDYFQSPDVYMWWEACGAPRECSCVLAAVGGGNSGVATEISACRLPADRPKHISDD